MDPAVAALRDGRAFVDLSDWRKILVHGTEAEAWLNDLLSAELAGLGVGAARRSLLLSPTGRIRADLTVARLAGGFLLVQDPRQPSAVHELLAPYVLSSDVRLDDRTEDLALLACPGADPPSIEGAERYRPSALGEGVDVLAPREFRENVRAEITLTEAGPEAVEAWRIERGMPRFGIDLREDSIPHEADVGRAIAYDKGCFLGQEAVAKVRNLGRPPFVVLAARSPSAVSAGDAVLSNGTEAGRVTSAVPVADGSALIARVRWEARDAELRTPSGEPLRVVGLASGPG
jgi:folate-binding protein YgfZ